MKKIYNLVLATVVSGAMSFTFFQNGSPTRQYIPREALPKQMSSWDGAVEIQKYLHGDNYTALTVYEELEKAERLASRKSGSLGINNFSVNILGVKSSTLILLLSISFFNQWSAFSISWLEL